MTWRYHNGIYSRRTTMALLEIVPSGSFSDQYRWRIRTWNMIETSLEVFSDDQTAALACDKAYERMIAGEVGNLVMGANV